MAKTKQSPEFEIVVDGETYVWWLQRKPQWSSDPKERHGMAIGVRHKDGKREAVLEFPAGDRPRFGAPKFQTTQISMSLVKTAITSGLAAGWEPFSRGKTVEIAVDEAGN